MTVVRVLALECIDTKGEATEEPYLCFYVGDDLVRERGPYKMRRGDTQWLNEQVQGDVIRVALSEEDRFRDERYGAIEVRTADEVENAEVVEHGRFVANLPPRGRTRYKLHFMTRPDDGHWPQARHCLDLVSLHCGDAQQSSDRVYLKVNGETVWGPQTMGTGDTLPLDSVGSIQVPELSTIQLWEEDSRRDDFFGELTLRIGDEFNLNAILPHTYSRDRGIVGDARYTLRYRVRERPWHTHTGWGRCDG